jgi:ubiquitin-protein ligase
MARRPADTVNLKPYSKFILEYKMRAEYNLLRGHGPPGMYVLPTSSPFIWDGVLFIRQGMYKNAILKFTVEIPSSFPDGVCPVVKFQPGVYHPQVTEETGEVNIAEKFMLSRKGPYHVHHVLEYVRSIFYEIDPKNPANEEAATLFSSNLSEFEAKVVACVESCSSAAVKGFPLDSNSIKLNEESWNVDVMRKAREEIFEKEVIKLCITHIWVLL